MISPYPVPDGLLQQGPLRVLRCSASDEQKAAAFEFIKYMTSDELLADWGIQTGYVAPREGSWGTQALQDYVAEVPQADVARRQIEVSVPEISTYEGQRVNEVLNAALQAALTGQQTPEAALTTAQAEAERILSAYRD
ncbi:MAG: extracellular solute-binding protein [Alphaproteobacteria bacterium]|nr:extracellular solute-binding protein [Alphaproteobacteria bacterium]